MFDVFEETPEEKEQSIVNMLRRRYPWKTIMKECNVSPSTISEVKKRFFGTWDTSSTQSNKPSKESQAFQLFQQGWSIIDVKIEFDIESTAVTEYFRRYQELRGLSEFNAAYDSVKGNIAPFFHLFYLMNNLAMSPENVEEQVRYGNNLPYLSNKHSALRNEVSTMESQKQQIQSQLNFMQNQIEDYTRSLKYYEDECLAKKNEISSLNYEIDTKKDFIQNLDNNEGYIRIKEAAKKETKLIMQDFRMTSAVTLSATVEAIRRYPDNQMLIFDITSFQNDSTIPYQQSWQTYAPRLLQLMQNVQNEIAEEITGDVVNTMKSMQYHKLKC